MSSDLERLYQEAKLALASKDYDHASRLIKQILIEDENYRDAARLLVQMVELRRRRWYNEPRLWRTVGVITIVGLLLWLVPKLPIQAVFAPTATLTANPMFTPTPTRTVIPGITPTLTAAPISLAWQRIYIGTEFPRDLVNAMALDPSDPDVIYVGMENAGVYKSIDGGASWFPAHTGLGTASVASLAIDFQDPQTLYAAVRSRGVYKTNDGGESWQPAGNGFQDQPPQQTGIAISPLDPDVLFYWSLSGLYQTTSAGESWNAIDRTCHGVIRNVVFHPANPQILFAQDLGYNEPECQGGIYKSTDGGKGWTITELNNAMRLGGPDLWIDNQQGQYLYAAVQREDNFEISELYGSRDGGNTWTLLLVLDRAGETFTACGIHPENSELVLCGGSYGALYKTTDGGQSWQILPALLEDTANSITFLAESEGRILLGGKSIYLSTNGGNSWTETNNGLGGGRLELFLDSTDLSTLYLEGKTNAFMWNDAPLYHSANAGQSWELITEEGHGLALDANKKYLYRLRRWSSPLRSQDDGHTWIEIPSPNIAIPSDTTWDPALCGLAAHPSIPGMLYAAIDTEGITPIEAQATTLIAHLFTSADGGNTWQEGRFPYPGFHLINTGNFVFGSGQELFLLPYNEKLFHSSDNGQTWSACGLESGAAFRSLAIDPNNEQHLFLATRGAGIQVSTDGCKTWHLNSIGLGSMFVNTVVIDPNNPDTLYAGTDSGAYVSFDSGQTWNEINEGLLGATVVYSIVVNQESNVYAATPYGIFKLESK